MTTDLTPKSARLFRRVAAKASPQRALAIRAALQQLDLANELRAAIEADGVLLRSRRSGLSRPHPALRSEQQARARFLRQWNRLGLTWDSHIDGVVTADDMEARRVEGAKEAWPSSSGEAAD